MDTSIFRPDLVIFDMDGLILDSERLFMEQEKMVISKYGYEMTTEDYKKTIGTGGANLRRILRELYGADYPMETVSRETRAQVDAIIQQQGPPVKKGIPELMQALKEAGIPACIATSTHTDIAERYMEMAGLIRFVIFVKGGEQVTKSKPDPEIFLQTCEKAGVAPERCLVLEDSPNGIRAALAAGMQVIAIPDMIPLPEELKGRVTAEAEDAWEACRLLSLS